MAKRNCSFNDDWLIEFEWVENAPVQELHIVNYAIIHLTFLIWEEVCLLVIQKGRSIKIRKFLRNHFRYHLLRERKAML